MFIYSNQIDGGIRCASRRLREDDENEMYELIGEFKSFKDAWANLVTDCDTDGTGGYDLYSTLCVLCRAYGVHLDIDGSATNDEILRAVGSYFDYMDNMQA